MGSLLTTVQQRPAALLFAVVFLEAIGIPIPAALALLVAGAAVAHGSLDPAVAGASALTAMMLGDVLMFLVGRYTGWWLLGVLCRLSLNPESCILRSAESFYRRGRLLLVVAKFIPGINTMAPPLAGSMNMRPAQFLSLDLAGAALYAGFYLGLGFTFSGALDAVTRFYEAFGRGLNGLIVLAVAAYLGLQLWTWTRTRKWRTVPFVRPSEAARAVSMDGAVIYDVRSHGYYDAKAIRIRGSSRIDPHLIDHLEQALPRDRPVLLYCTCVKEATSARVAYLLRQRNVPCAVIEGGLRAWKKAGMPTEPVPSQEVTALPVFEI
jgi:membrane protein DedA with SNARE-associated domain/rhodanese-related sulfurtransferase